MAGGEGSRLRPLTIMRPKPMVQIVNKPVMEHVLDLLRHHGITEVVVTVQYLASVIQDYFGDGSSIGMQITYSIEESPLGTAGSVKQAEDLLKDDSFIVISGDALTDFDLTKIIDFHKAHRATATLTLYQVPNPLEYGVVIIDDEGNIRQFLEKPSWGEVFSDTVNTGIYVLEPSIFDYIEPGRSVDFSQDVFPQLLKKGDRLFGFVSTGYWTDVGNIGEYMRANADVLNGKVKLDPIGKEIGGGIWIEDDDVEIAPDAQLYGPIWIGQAAKIKGGVIVRGPTVIRDYAILDTQARVDRSVIWRNSYIGERAEVRGAIICRQCSLRSKAIIFEGAVIGDQTSIGEGAVVQPGVKIWPNKEVEAGATVTSSIIWGSQGRKVLFGRWGVTGLVNIDLTPEFAARFGAAYGSTLPRGSTVVVNRDFHRSPRMIKRALIAGLPSAGVSALDIKTMPIPVARYITRSSKASGGVHVRISPFDGRVVDIKIFDSQGLDIDTRTERKIESIYFREDVRRVYLDELGLIEDAPQLASQYTDGFLRALGELPRDGLGRPLVIDYGHAPATEVLPKLLSSFGWEVIALNAGLVEHNLARATQEFDSSMQQLAIITRSLNARLGVRIDTGGEKIFVVDDYGNHVGGWELLAAVALLTLKETPGKAIAVPVSAPNLLDWVAEQTGSRVIRTRVEPQALMVAASSDDVILAGDGDGGIIFPSFHPGMDGMFAVARLYQLLLRNQTNLTDVLASLPAFYLARTRVPCPWDTKGRVMRILSQQYQSPDVRQIDGVKIDVGGGEWVLVLPDIDRPLFHVIAESRTADSANDLMERYAALVNSLQK